MRYLKRYNESVTFEEMFNDLINWEMINTIKDLSLDYLDQDYTLEINVIYVLKVNDQYDELPIYKIICDHEVAQEHYYTNSITVRGFNLILTDIAKDIRKENIKYDIYLENWKELGRDVYDKNATKQLISKIVDIFPEERNNIIRTGPDDKYSFVD